jgi:hypothetical protein
MKVEVVVSPLGFAEINPNGLIYSGLDGEDFI